MSGFTHGEKSLFKRGLGGAFLLLLLISSPMLRAAVPTVSAAMDKRAPHCFRIGEQAYAQRDFTGARQWYRQAASLGHAEAAFRLARMYQNGQAGQRNEQEAMHLLSAAAARGHRLAASELGLLRLNRDYSAQSKQLEQHVQAPGDDFQITGSAAVSSDHAASTLQITTNEYQRAAIAASKPAQVLGRQSSRSSAPPEAPVPVAVLPQTSTQIAVAKGTLGNLAALPPTASESAVDDVDRLVSAADAAAQSPKQVAEKRKLDLSVDSRPLYQKYQLPAWLDSAVRQGG